MIATLLASIMIFQAQVTCYTYNEHTSACIFEEPNGEYYVHICIDHKCREVPKPERPVPAKKHKRK